MLTLPSQLWIMFLLQFLLNSDVFRAALLSLWKLSEKKIEVNKFAAVGSYKTVAAASDYPTSSRYTVWFIKVVEKNCIQSEVSKDSYKHDAAPGFVHLLWHFLGKDVKRSSLKANMLKFSKRIRHFFKKSNVYPYVNIV